MNQIQTLQDIEIEDVFQQAGAKGFFHATPIEDQQKEVALNADEPVITASVFKIAVLVELVRHHEAKLADRITVPASRKTMGPTGLSVTKDDVDMSVRDLAYLMMSVSDNTATDVLMEFVGGSDPINKTLRDLGRSETNLVGDCHVLLSQFVEDLELTPDEIKNEELGQPVEIAPERYEKCRSLRALETNRTTPRDTTRLLSRIWQNEAASPEGCEQIRRIMSLQVWPHRLSSGFFDGVKIAAKTGTLPGIRNESGVVTYPDGQSYAVAVFTKADTYTMHQPAVDASIGRAGRLAIDSLRS